MSCPVWRLRAGGSILMTLESERKYEKKARRSWRDREWGAQR